MFHNLQPYAEIQVQQVTAQIMNGSAVVIRPMHEAEIPAGQAQEISALLNKASEELSASLQAELAGQDELYSAPSAHVDIAALIARSRGISLLSR